MCVVVVVVVCALPLSALGGLEPNRSHRWEPGDEAED